MGIWRRAVNKIYPKVVKANKEEAVARQAAVTQFAERLNWGTEIQRDPPPLRIEENKHYQVD